MSLFWSLLRASQLMKTPDSMFQLDNSVMNFYSNKANKESCWSINRLQKVSPGSLKNGRLETGGQAMASKGVKIATDSL